MAYLEAVPAVSPGGNFNYRGKPFTVICLRCNKGVDAVMAHVHQERRLMNLFVRCHGEEESVEMTSERLGSDPLILAFDPKDRP